MLRCVIAVASYCLICVIGFSTESDSVVAAAAAVSAAAVLKQ